MFYTSIIGNDSIGFGRIKAIGKSRAKVSREPTRLIGIYFAGCRVILPMEPQPLTFLNTNTFFYIPP